MAQARSPAPGDNRGWWRTPCPKSHPHALRLQSCRRPRCATCRIQSRPPVDFMPELKKAWTRTALADAARHPCSIFFSGQPDGPGGESRLCYAEVVIFPFLSSFFCPGHHNLIVLSYVAYAEIYFPTATPAALVPAVPGPRDKSPSSFFSSLRQDHSQVLLAAIASAVPANQRPSSPRLVAGGGSNILSRLRRPFNAIQGAANRGPSTAPPQETVHRRRFSASATRPPPALGWSRWPAPRLAGEITRAPPREHVFALGRRSRAPLKGDWGTSRSLPKHCCPLEAAGKTCGVARRRLLARTARPYVRNRPGREPPRLAPADAQTIKLFL